MIRASSPGPALATATLRRMSDEQVTQTEPEPNNSAPMKKDPDTRRLL